MRHFASDPKCLSSAVFPCPLLISCFTLAQGWPHEEEEVVSRVLTCHSEPLPQVRRCAMAEEWGQRLLKRSGFCLSRGIFPRVPHQPCLQPSKHQQGSGWHIVEQGHPAGQSVLGLF